MASPGIEKPGEITFYNDDGKVIRKTEIQLNSSKGFKQNPSSTMLKGLQTSLGANLYDKKTMALHRPK